MVKKGVFLPFMGGLANKAFLEEKGRGRRDANDSGWDYPFSCCMNPFGIDADLKISISQARQRGDKMQVFYPRESPHISNRLSHTNEVTALAIAIASILGLNVSLCRAIAEGHDIGHAPYGHFGETFISDITGRPFAHEVFAIVLAQEIECKGQGLNLNFETLEGILHHSYKAEEIVFKTNLPPEYLVVMIADKIAWVLSDIDDAIRLNLIAEKDLPIAIKNLGANQSERTITCLYWLLKESCEKGLISFSDSKTAEMFMEARRWMFKEVYNKRDFTEETKQLKRAYEVIAGTPMFEGCDPAILLAMTTEEEVIKIAHSANGMGIENLNLGIAEIAPHIRGEEIDFTSPGLDWGLTTANKS